MKTMTTEAFLDAYASGERDFQNVNLRGARLRGAYLSGIDLSFSRLSDADLTDARLYDARLTGADLTDARLSGARLAGADLSGARLTGADLSGARLYDARLTGADLSGARLSRADMSGADLTDANMTDADMTRARLRGAQNLDPATAAQLMRCPSVGEFIAYKQCAGGAIVKLLVPADAKRSSATSNKCRASHVLVLEGEGTSRYDPSTRYYPGARVECDRWGEDRWEECTGGIHFFMTHEEAEAYTP